MTMNNRELIRRYAAHTAKHFQISLEITEEKDDTLAVFDGWVSIEQGDIEVMHPATICKTAEKIIVPGFIVTTAITRPSWSHWEPDDVDIEEVGQYRNIADAVQEALLTVLRNGVQNALQSEAEALWYEEQKALEASGALEQI